MAKWTTTGPPLPSVKMPLTGVGQQAQHMLARELILCAEVRSSKACSVQRGLPACQPATNQWPRPRHCTRHCEHTFVRSCSFKAFTGGGKSTRHAKSNWCRCVYSARVDSGATTSWTFNPFQFRRACTCIAGCRRSSCIAPSCSQ